MLFEVVLLKFTPHRYFQQESDVLMGFYSNSVFPRLYDCLVDRPNWAEYRKSQLCNAGGDILEIGAGTGLNLAHYPADVERITTVDPNPGMNKRLKRRIEQSGIAVNRRVMSCETLPFETASFDCVVSTLTLCSVRNLQPAISEVLRVLRPGGRLLFLEHGLSPDANVAAWQRRMNGIHGVFADGCTLTLDVRGVLEGHPFAQVETENFYLAGAPKIYGYMYQGVATKNPGS